MYLSIGGLEITITYQPTRSMARRIDARLLEDGKPLQKMHRVKAAWLLMYGDQRGKLRDCKEFVERAFLENGHGGIR